MSTPHKIALCLLLGTLFLGLGSFVSETGRQLSTLKARVLFCESEPRADRQDIDALMASRARINQTISAINRTIKGLIEDVEGLSQRIGRLEIRPVPSQAIELVFIPAAVTNGPAIAFRVTPDP